MTTTRRPTVSVVMVTHNSASLIPDVLMSLLSDPDGPDEVLIVDSASTDDTLRVLANHAVKAHPQTENVGFARGCHIGVDASDGEVVVFLGHDTVPEHGWLLPLVGALSEEVGAVMATIEEAEAPGTFNTSGGSLTYFGVGSISDQGEPIPPDEPSLVEVAFPSGAAMAMTRITWERFGGFRTDFFMYQEDADLGWRLRLAGLRVLRASRSRVRHHYEFGRSAKKMYFLERNRWLMLRANYRPSTLALLAPALLVVELGVTLVSIRDGWAAEKVSAWIDAARAPSVRGLTDRDRLLDDGEMLGTMGYRLSEISQVRPPVGTELVESLLGFWQRFAVLMLRWIRRFG